jgi:hypothetical protein
MGNTYMRFLMYVLPNNQNLFLAIDYLWRHKIFADFSVVPLHYVTMSLIRVDYDFLEKILLSK